MLKTRAPNVHLFLISSNTPPSSPPSPSSAVAGVAAAVMNYVRRAIIAERKRLFTLSPTSILQKQHASSSSTTRNTVRPLKSSKTREPEVRSQPARAPPPAASPPSTSSYSKAVQKEPVTWPKPSEIPWQAKVVNSVNLIGQVKIPVQFEASSDGKNWAGTIISLDDGSESSPSLPTFWIPVIFEGDLAHIAMCHLKEKDYVHVAGHLSVDVPPFKLSEVQANVQVMVHSINFVQGSQSKKISTPGELDKWTTKNSAIPENNIVAQQSLEEFNPMSKQSSTLSEMVVAYEGNSGQLLNNAESSPAHNSKEVGRSHSDRKADRQSTHASWRDLLINSKQWLDNRERKRKGSVKANYPDFKHKDTGIGLWLNNAPPEVLQGLGQLEFYSKGNNDSWKNLVENPNKWWDNRLDKRNPKAPDFKHKDSGEVLWLGDAPGWALSSLPPPKAKSVDIDTKKAWRAS